MQFGDRSHGVSEAEGASTFWVEGLVSEGVRGPVADCTPVFADLRSDRPGVNINSNEWLEKAFIQ